MFSRVAAIGCFSRSSIRLTLRPKPVRGWARCSSASVMAGASSTIRRAGSTGGPGPPPATAPHTERDGQQEERQATARAAAVGTALQVHPPRLGRRVVGIRAVHQVGAGVGYPDDPGDVGRVVEAGPLAAEVGRRNAAELDL